MKCPTLKDLPEAPKSREGWPWTEECPGLPPLMPDSSEWPAISIVTPSYNYAHFIEETIRSVLLQGYPNIEYIIIDGKSKDNSVEIIRKYEKYLKFWVSEPDKGYGDAVNKGYKRCSGKIFAWIGTDDVYEPGCFKDVAELCRRGHQFMIGECLNIKLDKDFTKVIEELRHSSRPQTFDQYIKWWSHKYIPQPAAFTAKNIAEKALPLDNRMAADFGFFLRILKQNPNAIWAPRIWVKAKYHGKNLSAGSDIFMNYLLSHEIALEEASRAYGFFKKLVFAILSKDNLSFFKMLLEDSDGYTIIQLLKLFISWPFIIRRPIFLKALLKLVIGDKNYMRLKRLRKK